MKTTAEKVKVTEEVVTTVEHEMVTLTLSMDAASALCALADYVGGLASETGRGHIDSIREELTAVGITSGDYVLDGIIYFTN